MLQKEQQHEHGSAMAEEKIIEAALASVARNFSWRPKAIHNGVLRFSELLYFHGDNGLWLSLVERLVRDQEAVGSNPTSPINCDTGRPHV
jgi:hypothetical protein